MNINEFLHLSAGKWFSQRTNYDLNKTIVASNKADLVVDFLAADDSAIVALCQQHNLASHSCLGGVRQNWDNSVDWGKTPQKGSAVIVLLGESDDNRLGKLLRMTQGKIEQGRYLLGDDLALTLIVESNNFYAEERQWFASDNLKLRTTYIKDNSGNTQTSFYSEIRKAPPRQEPAKATASSNS